MRFDNGPLDILFFFSLCLISIALYDSALELTPKKFFHSAAGVDVEDRSALRHLLSHALFSLITTVFIFNAFVSVTPTPEWEISGKTGPAYGPFTQGLGYFSANAPQTFTVSSKVALLADAAFWLMSAGLHLNRLVWVG